MIYTAPVNDSVEEPFYIDPIRRSELYESIRVAQVYEVPTTSLSPGQKKSNSDIKDEDNDNYHTLEPPVVSQGRRTSKEGYGEHDYHELEAPSNHSDEDTDDEPVEQSNAVRESFILYLSQFYLPIYSIVNLMKTVQLMSSMSHVWYVYYIIIIYVPHYIYS